MSILSTSHPRPFRGVTQLMRSSVSQFMASREYHGIGEELDACLYLADRVLIAVRHDLEHGHASDLAARLGSLLSGDRATSGDVASIVRNIAETDLERWLKTLFELIDPDMVAKLRAADQDRTDKHYDMGAAIVGLGLLTHEEIGQQPDLLAPKCDPVRVAIQRARKMRNSIHATGSSEIAATPDAILRDVMICLIAPVYKHKSALGRILSCVVTRELQLNNNDMIVIQSVNQERQMHLDRFAGREAWLTRLEEKLRPSGGSVPYILLHAPESVGKSALISKLSEHLTHDRPVIGSARIQVKRSAPWLPTLLFHMCKQSPVPEVITRLLVAQANCLTLETVTLADKEIVDSGPLPEKILAGLWRAQNAAMEGNVAGWESGVPYVQPGSAPARSQGLPKVMSLLRAHDVEEMRRQLFYAFKVVADELGRTLLILDALDEIPFPDAQLGFLPESLPDGVTALLTCRPNSDSYVWLERNRQVEKIHLSELNRKDIIAITRVQPTSEASKKFLDKLEKTSKGWAHQVTLTAEELRRVNGDFTKVSVDSSATVLNRLAEKFCHQNDADPRGILRHLLPLLALFEPCCSLTVDNLQGYLSSQGVDVSSAEIRDALRLVADLFDGLETNLVKLSIRMFADHVRSRFYTAREIDSAKDSVCRWFVEDTRVEGATIAQFLAKYGTASDDCTRTDGDSNALLCKLLEKRGTSCLETVGRRMARITGKLSPLSEECLRMAADQSDSDAMHFLGHALLCGDGIAKNETEGLNYLRSAVTAGNRWATLELGQRLIEGDGLERDEDEGVQLLRALCSKDDRNAVRVLASHFLASDSEERRGEGMAMLLRAAEDGDCAAMTVLGGRMIDGHGVDQDLLRGEEWLQRACEQGYPLAMASYGRKLATGERVSKDVDHGEQLMRNAVEGKELLPELILATYLLSKPWRSDKENEEAGRLLRAAAESDDFGAMTIYSDYLVHNVESGAQSEDLTLLVTKLTGLSESGNVHAMRKVASLLLDGVGIRQDVMSGQRWIRKACSMGDVAAMLDLGKRLINGEGIPQNQSEGIEWLRNAAKTGDVSARRILGWRLIEGRGVQEGVTEGVQLLTEAANEGDHRSMWVLGETLIKRNRSPEEIAFGWDWCRKAAGMADSDLRLQFADKLLDEGQQESDFAEAVGILRELADSGEDDAMHSLGSALLNGNHVEKNVAEGVAWLNKAVEAGSTSALIELAEAHFTKSSCIYDPSIGKQLLEEAGRRGVEEATHDLGIRLIEGTEMAKDVARGVELLRANAVRNYAPSQRALGEHLLESKERHDLIAGEKWLRASCQSNNPRALIALADALITNKIRCRVPHEGELLLRRVADAYGYAPAMMQLGEHLLDGDQLRRDEREGTMWLERAAQEGWTPAKIRLGSRMISGDGVQPEPVEGMRLLKEAADSGDSRGKLEYAEQLITGPDQIRDSSRGLDVLSQLKESCGEFGPSVARAYYKAGEKAKAEDLLLQLWNDGDEYAGLNLGYMLRRGELSPNADLTLVDLLRPALEKKEHYARMNHALALAAGFQCKPNWSQADQLIKRFTTQDAKSLLIWWQPLAESGDAEGHMVIGWLLRHRLVRDPNQWTVKQRMDKAREGGWQVPTWMDSPSA